MKYVHLLAALCCTACSINVGDENQTEVFEYGEPVDLSVILRAYYWYELNEGDDKDSILFSFIDVNLPEDEIYLFEDTAFVLRVLEPAHSQQPFLATAEDFYNSCALSWNVWSNFEVWYRGHTSGLLRNEDDIRNGIEAISANIIKDGNVRNAAQTFKDSLLLNMKTEPSEWDEDFSPYELLNAYNEVIESIAYRFYDDEESFIASLDSISDIAESMAMDVFQNYLNADEETQVYVIIAELPGVRRLMNNVHYGAIGPTAGNL